MAGLATLPIYSFKFRSAFYLSSAIQAVAELVLFVFDTLLSNRDTFAQMGGFSDVDYRSTVLYDFLSFSVTRITGLSICVLS